MEVANHHDEGSAPEPNKYPNDSTFNVSSGSQEGDSNEPSTDSIKPPCAPSRDSPSLSKEEAEGMFRTLREIFEPLEQQQPQRSGELEDLTMSLELADKGTPDGHPNIQPLKDVTYKVDRLWRSRSEYMVNTVEVLANGSRDRESSEKGVPQT